MSLLLHGDCLDLMKSIDDNSVDLIFCDLPYGQTSCKWDIIIPWEPFWNEILRIKKLNTPIFFTTTTKFGVELINNAPKKCPFRYDLVWVKSAPAGFLSAKKMPMRKHEMVYCFYEKLPLYDLSSHTHKFIKSHDKKEIGGLYSDKIKRIDGKKGQYDPPLPVSVVKEDERKINPKNSNKGGLYSKINRLEDVKYDPPLPVSVVKEIMNSELYGELPTTDSYAESIGINKADKHKVHYDPPLPTSVVKEEKMNSELYGELPKTKNFGKSIGMTSNQSQGQPRYDPPLPTTMLEIKSTRGKHSTEKPVALMEWLLKYYSKEGDTVLDPTMGSGSTGVACKNMNRNFIGIEKDPEIYEVAVNRID